MSLITAVAEYIMSDDEDDSERLVSTYRNATPEQRKLIDDIFITLCGWSLETLIANEED